MPTKESNRCIMVLLTTFNNQVSAQLLESRLKASGVDTKIEVLEGMDTYRVLVFEDDLEEAKEIMESADTADDSDMYIDFDDEMDLDDFDDE
ncbi:MAG: hypothetical protein D8M52_00105 [Chlorobi bacterium]|nr:MAG: DUF2007 domain-containing protein [Bacteroidota bacterium]MBL1160105.1 hypothetical protein [Chlorobiota bacterium]